MSSMKNEIAVLVTEDGKEVFGGAEEIWSYHAKRFKDVVPHLKLVPFFVCRGRFPNDIEDYKAYIITGAHYSVNKKLEWMLKLEDCIRSIRKKPHIRLLAICFGHQIVAKALGGIVGRNPSGEFIWRCDKIEISKELASKQYYIDSKLSQSGFYIMQSHEDQVLKKPDDAKVMASNNDCKYEVLLYDNNILTLQGHPEIESKKMMKRIPSLEKSAIVSKEQIRNAINSFNNDEADRTTTFIANFLTYSD